MAAKSHAYEIAADDDEDLELQDDLVATSRDGLLPTHLAPAAANNNKNKGKGKERATSPASLGLEGRIGSNAAAAGAGGQRQTAFGGIQTETRSVLRALLPCQYNPLYTHAHLPLAQVYWNRYAR